MNSENRIIAYMVVTAVMVVTFICAIAISKGFYSATAWVVLLGMNLSLLIYLSRKE